MGGDVTINKYYPYDNQYYKSKTGVNTTTPPDLDTTNWELIPKSILNSIVVYDYNYDIKYRYYVILNIAYYNSFYLSIKNPSIG